MTSFKKIVSCFDNLFNLNLKFGVVVANKVSSFIFGRPKKEKKEVVA
jgi:hypothetical protein